MTRFILLILSILLTINPIISQEISEIIFKDYFSMYPDGSDEYPGWLAVNGNWQVVSGKYYQKSAEYECASFLDTYMNTAVEFEITFEHNRWRHGRWIYFFLTSAREHSILTYGAV